MLKNVKIDEETHRLLSVKAAELSILKGNLCSVLIRAAIEKLDDDTIKLLSEQYENDAG